MVYTHTHVIEASHNTCINQQFNEPDAVLKIIILSGSKQMGEFGGQNAHSTLNTDCESGV